MSFAILEYSKKEAIKEKSLVGKLPQSFKEKYKMCFIPLEIENYPIGDVVGYKITVPITKKETEKVKIRFLKKVVSFLIEKDIKFLINKDKIPIEGNFIEITGNKVKAMCILPIIKKYRPDLKEAKVVLIDGENVETNIVLEKLFGEINYLSIKTKDREKFSVFEEETYLETGLVIEFFGETRSKQIKEADIIINCDKNLDRCDYLLKKGAIYIEVSQSNEVFDRIEIRRKDVELIKNIEFKINNYVFDEFFAEVYLYIKADGISNVFYREFKSLDYMVYIV